jgi:hypothetical protein
LLNTEKQRGKVKGGKHVYVAMAKREVTTKTQRRKHGVNTGREVKPKRPRNVLSNIVPLYFDGHVKRTDPEQ